MADDTIFDLILKGEIPSTTVYEDDFVKSIKDIDPKAPVHIIVIPKHKIVSLRDTDQASDSDLAGFMRGISKTAAEIGLNDGGYRVVFNTGRDAQQSVAYIHAHILGGRTLAWPPG